MFSTLRCALNISMYYLGNILYHSMWEDAIDHNAMATKGLCVVKLCVFVPQVSHGQAQQASDAHANDLKETIRQGVEEANDLRAQLATVVPRQQLTNAENRIKVCVSCLIYILRHCYVYSRTPGLNVHSF